MLRSLTKVAQDQDAIWEIVHLHYKDILAKDKFLALRAGYKPSLTGCKPAIITAVTVEFEGGQ